MLTTQLIIARAVHRNVLCEVCLGVAVVAIVACLGVMPPARHLYRYSTTTT